MMKLPVAPSLIIGVMYMSFPVRMFSMVKLTLDFLEVTLIVVVAVNALYFVSP